MAKRTVEAAEKKTRKPKSLKIERKRKSTAKKTVKVKLTVKQAKLDRVLRKLRTNVRRALKKAIRHTGLKRIPDKLYKKIDTSIAKNSDLTAIVETAIVNAVNELPALKNGKATVVTEKKSRKRQPKVKEAAAEPTKNKKNSRKKKEAEPAATEA